MSVVDKTLCLVMQKTSKIKLNLNDETALKTTEHTSAAHELFDYNSLCDLNSILSPGEVEKQTRMVSNGFNLIF